MEDPDAASPEGNLARASAHMLTQGPLTPDKKKCCAWLYVQDTLLSYFLQPCARANGDKSETVMSMWTSIQDP